MTHGKQTSVLCVSDRHSGNRHSAGHLNDAVQRVDALRAKHQNRISIYLSAKPGDGAVDAR